MAEDAGSAIDSGTWHGVAPSHVGQAYIHGKDGMWESGMKALTFKATEGEPWQPHRARGPGPKMVAEAAAKTKETQRRLVENLRPENLRKLHDTEPSRWTSAIRGCSASGPHRVGTGSSRPARS